jgi:hypothetical protein
MDSLQNILQNKKFIPSQKKSNLTTPHQIQGVMIAKKLGVKKSSEFAQVIRCVKQNPGMAERAYSWVSDYPSARSLLRLFFWKFHQLKSAPA